MSSTIPSNSQGKSHDEGVWNRIINPWIDGGYDIEARPVAASSMRDAWRHNRQELSLARLGLSLLPSCLSFCRSLQVIDLSHNQLAEIPPHLPYASLRRVKLVANRIGEVTNTLPGWHRKLEIHLDKNPLNEATLEFLQETDGLPQFFHERLLAPLPQLVITKACVSPVIILKELKELVNAYAQNWSPLEKCFFDIPFHPERFTQLLEAFCAQFPFDFNPETEQGIIQKFDLPSGAQLAVRADLHGDLKSLIETLKSLQQVGFLTEDYLPANNNHIVFLGDYMDRGSHSLQVLELLLTLKIECPNQVTLLRGNHESTSTNKHYLSSNDEDFYHFLYQVEGPASHLNRTNQTLLTDVYRTMPLGCYIAHNMPNGLRQYCLFTHGTMHTNIDPSALLDDASPVSVMKIPLSPPLAPRFSKIKTDSSIDEAALLAITSHKTMRRVLKRSLAAKSIKSLGEKILALYATSSHIKFYTYGDMTRDIPQLGNPLHRQWKLTPELIKASLSLSSTTNKVKCLFRGHQHNFECFQVNGKTVAVTLPIGCNSHANQAHNAMDVVTLFSLAPLVKDWEGILFWRKEQDHYERSPQQSFHNLLSSNIIVC